MNGQTDGQQEKYFISSGGFSTQSQGKDTSNGKWVKIHQQGPWYTLGCGLYIPASTAVVKSGICAENQRDHKTKLNDITQQNAGKAEHFTPPS